MDLTMPRLSDTMEEGTVGRWLKREGDVINKGDIIAEIETDKANMELEAFQAGVLERIVVGEGQTVPVGETIAVIGSGDGSQPAATVQQDTSPPAVAPRSADTEAPEPAAAEASAEAPAPEAVREGPQGRVRASPLARRIAQELGVDLSTVRGSGPNGRIKREDVEQAVASAAPPPSRVPAPVAAAPAAEPVPGEVQPLTRIQKIIAQRMVESKTQVPHIYITTEVDMARAVLLRQELNALGGQQVSFNDIVIKACGLALRSYTLANASFASEGIRYNQSVNVGFAVAVQGALLVPVVRDVDEKPLREVAAEARALIQKARDNKLSPQDISGGTFTVSNLGMYGVDEFQAVVNPPEAAILAVGAIAQKPVVQDGQIVPGTRMRMTLSADHRVLYGADAAEFLAELRQLLESPLNLGF